MNRHTMFVLTSMLLSGVAVVTLPEKALSQQKTLKEQIQGPWQLVSCNNTTTKGEKADYCTNNPRGILILAGNGNYATMIFSNGRKDFDAPGVAANFGTWSVDEVTKTLTRHFVGSHLPSNEGHDFKVNVSLNGDEMHLVGDTNVPGNPVAHLDATYRRFK